MIASVLIAGFTLGAFGSLHCVGMCGPLALALPVHHLSGAKKIIAATIYNLGRVLTYSILGLVMGFIGKGFFIAGWEQLFSITIGSTLLIFTILYFAGKKNYQPNWYRNFTHKLQYLISNLLNVKNYAGYFLIGIANGLLPCGLVYVAISTALVLGNELSSTLFMASFGLATVPAMLLLTVMGTKISLAVRNNMKRATPFVIVTVAILLILRGLSLDIPYISPALSQTGTEKVQCH
jgi:sulfite exporter TauE/SafE